MPDSPPKQQRLGPLPQGSSGFAFAGPEPGGSVPEALIGQRIKALRKELGLTQVEFAAALDTTQSAVSKWERRDETPSDVFVERIATLSGTTPGYIRYGEAYQCRRVPLIGHVGTGAEISPLEVSEAVDGLSLPALVPHDAVALLVQGDALFPEIDDGTLLIYRRDLPFAEDACLAKRCVVAVKDGPWLVKRVVRGSALGRFTLLSTSTPPIADIEVTWAGPILAYIAR